MAASRDRRGGAELRGRRGRPVADRHPRQFLLGQHRAAGNARLPGAGGAGLPRRGRRLVTPFISGKDSLNNEFSYVDAAGRRQTVAIPPSLLISALGQIDDVCHAVTMDVKEAGNVLYLVGRTQDELGGLHFALVERLAGGRRAAGRSRRWPEDVRGAASGDRRRSRARCHDLSEGGLAVAAAEMAFAGGLGLELELAPLRSASGLEDPAVLLFSESNTRFLIEVPARPPAGV